MAQQTSIFSRLRAMQLREGQPLSDLIEEACDVGDELVRVLATMTSRDLEYQGSSIIVRCESHSEALRVANDARRALDRAFTDDGDTPDNGAQVA